MAKLFKGKLVFLTLLLAGALGGFGFAPFHLFPLALLSYGVLFYALTQLKLAGKLRAFALGWVWAFAFFVSSLWWTGNALLVDNNPYVWALPLAISGLPALLAFFPAFAALAFTIVRWLVPLSPLRQAILFAVFLAISEYARAYCFTGFPWNMPAYIWGWNLPLLQSLSLFGPFVLALLTLLLANASALVFLEKEFRCKFIPVITVIILLFMLTLWGGLRLSSNPLENSNDKIGTYIRLVQPNISQADKWNSAYYDQHILKMVNLALTPFSLRMSEADNIIIVLPETALNERMLSSPMAYVALETFFNEMDLKDAQVLLYAGAMRSETHNGERRFYNSSYVFDTRGRVIETYDKFHLVPFGEYMPFANIIPIEAVTKFSGMEFGSGIKTLNIGRFPSFSPLICYEILFPGHVRPPQQRPDMLINITNDAWYGDAPGPYQHVENAIYRAIEEGVSVYRSANTGISIGVDPYGRTLQKLPLMQEGVVDVRYVPPIAQTLYSKIGNNFFVVISFLISALCLLARPTFKNN